MDPALGMIRAGDFARLEFAPLDQSPAEILAAWTYPGPYAFYDFAADAEDLAELLDPDARARRYFAVVLESYGLIGFVELTTAGEGVIEIGLGLRPDCTGRGLGERFVARVCEWASDRKDAQTLILRVAAFNARAITVYERAGFTVTGHETVSTNGGLVPFVVMTRPRSLVAGAGHAGVRSRACRNDG